MLIRNGPVEPSMHSVVLDTFRIVLLQLLGNLQLRTSKVAYLAEREART